MDPRETKKYLAPKALLKAFWLNPDCWMTLGWPGEDNAMVFGPSQRMKRYKQRSKQNIIQLILCFDHSVKRYNEGSKRANEFIAMFQ